MLLLVYLVSLTAAFTALFPPTAGHRPKYRRTGKPHSRPHTLHPTVHPAIDRTDAQHLKATTGLSLHYHDPHAAFPRIRSFASVHVSEFIHPAVALEHSAHIVETICHSNVSTITVQFRNRDAWAIAKEDWKTHPNAFLVAFSDSCGLGRESGERSIHRVRNMTASWGKMEIAFEMTETPLKDAIHPDRDVEIVINTFEVHDPRPSVPNDRSRLRRRAGGAKAPRDGPDGDGQPPSGTQPNQSGVQQDPDGTGGGGKGPGATQTMRGTQTMTPTETGATQSSGDTATNDTDASLADDSSALSDDDDDDDDDYYSEIYDLIYDADGNIDYEAVANISESWYNTSNREANMNGTVDLSAYEYFDPEDGFDELEGDIPGFDPLGMYTDKRELGRRGTCKFSWNPFAILRDCILLPIFKVVQSAVQTIASVINKLIILNIVGAYKLLKAVITIVAAVLSERGYTPSGEVTFDTNISLPMKYTEDFGYAYFLAGTGPLSGAEYSKGDHSVAGNLTAYCVGCRIDGFFKYQSKFRFTFSKGFTDAEVELVNGRIDFSAGIGILFDLTLSGTLHEEKFPTIPLSPLTIPGIITVGPFIQVTAGIGYEVNAQGKFLARNNIGWSDMTAKIDMVNGDNSFIGEWTPTKPVPVVSLEFEGSASIGPFVAAGLKFGVDILNGKLTIAAGLEVKASLPVGITASIEAGTGMETAFQDCQGFNVTLKTMIEIYVLLEAGPARKQFNITPPFEFPIVNQCIQLSTAKTMNQLVPDIPPPVLDEYYPGQVNRLVTAEYEGGKTLQLVWLPIPNDNIYALPPLDKAEDARYVVNRLFVGSKNVSDTKATAGSYDNRVFYHEDLMPIDVGRDTIIHLGSYAPLRLASSEFVPIGVRVVALRMDTDDSGKPFIGVVGPSKTPNRFDKYLYPVVCFYKEKKIRPAQVFLVKDDTHLGPKLAIGALPRVNREFKECSYARFTIT